MSSIIFRTSRRTFPKVCKSGGKCIARRITVSFKIFIYLFLHLPAVVNLSSLTVFRCSSFPCACLIVLRSFGFTRPADIFLSEVSGLVHTFPQLVYHQDTIVQSLQNHLLVPNSTALEPLLDLVVQLVRDLQKDFYPHFHRFFFITTGLLDARDPDQLEWVFTCLSYLFKFLWRLLIKDIHSVYSMYSPLLEHKKEHIRHFAAESFSFLMRKVLLFDCFMLSSSCFGMLFIGFISSGTLLFVSGGVGGWIGGPAGWV
uniref:Uncharacterized protein n=1 Tax=Eptatretus burgeri TaxID=7764 RepID=A0A8C4NBG0_EPTBU